MHDDETIHADEGSPAGGGRGNLTTGGAFAGRYDVREPLGRGGMGAVYLVHDRQLDELVALKLLTLESERAVERFRREVRLARRVTHPNVARTHDLGEHEGRHFLTMEYVRGASIDEVLAAGPLPPERVWRIGAQIALGLEAAHAAGVVHRDLKPANVLLAEGDRVVITDFGIARLTEAAERTHETGVLVGTPHYMAPEQVLGQPVDARTDVYALGLMLFEMCTGGLPFDDDNPMVAALARTHRPAPDPRTRLAVPDALAALILRCLSREPDARPESAHEVAELLDALSRPEPSGPRAALRAPSGSTSGGGARRDTNSSGSTSSGPTPRGATWSGIGLFAPMSPGRQAVAVLPMTYRGAVEHEYLGEGLAEELIDVLSQTRGLRVLALGATRRFAEDRDPGRIGAELGADAVVDGRVQLAGERVRVSARLIETETGLVRWTEHVETRFEDVFVLQETLARRVAEALRLELDAAAHRSVASPEAIQLYLRARRLVRGDNTRATEALALLERGLELAPDLLPAYPAYAMAQIRALWDERAWGGRDALAEAAASVAAAVERAPELAETQLARAMLALQHGDHVTATRALARALEIAPTLAEAHSLLGDLQVEAGRMAEGEQRCRLAVELDPTLVLSHFPLARAAALRGEWEAAHRHLDAVHTAGATNGVAISQLRFALWRADREELRRIGDILRASDTADGIAVARIAGVAAGDLGPEEGVRVFATIERESRSPRFQSLALQFSVEVFSTAGARELALAALARCAEGPLIDVDWMRRCPPVTALRDDPRYARALEQVTQRARRLWR